MNRRDPLYRPHGVKNAPNFGVTTIGRTSKAWTATASNRWLLLLEGFKC
jgi:hypothetical protein